MSQIKKITKLTAEQIAKFPEYIKKWTDIGLCTAPANREAAEKAINESYILAGLKPPKKIVWCGSPLSQGLVRAIILDKKLVGNVGKNMRESMEKSVRHTVWDNVRDSVGHSVGHSVRENVWHSVAENGRGSVGNSVWHTVRDSVGHSVGHSVRENVWHSVAQNVRDSVGHSIRENVWHNVAENVRGSVGNSVWHNVEHSVRENVWHSVWDSVRESSYGQHDANWLAFYDFFRNECNLMNEMNKLNGLTEVAKYAGWFLPHENICWISERHCILNRDEEGRLHSLTEAAVAYPDGWKIYAVHGVRVPGWIIETPEKITIDTIEKEENSEIRRVMTDLYGLDKYIENCGAIIVHSDSFGQLFRKEIKDDEPIVMVKVINSTAEPTGEFKNYFLRIPPEIKTAKEAVAWTFGLSDSEYQPLIET